MTNEKKFDDSEVRAAKATMMVIHCLRETFAAMNQHGGVLAKIDPLTTTTALLTVHVGGEALQFEVSVTVIPEKGSDEEN